MCYIIVFLYFTAILLIKTFSGKTILVSSLVLIFYRHFLTAFPVNVHGPNFSVVYIRWLKNPLKVMFQSLCFLNRLSLGGDGMGSLNHINVDVNDPDSLQRVMDQIKNLQQESEQKNKEEL